MSKLLEKQKAIELRRAGLSYREIRQQVPVAKATLSLWLRSVGLSRPQTQRLTEKRLAAGRRGAEKVHRERLQRVRSTKAEAEREASRRIQQGDWLWLLGTALYWAEGSKPKAWRPFVRVTFTNMDPHMVSLIRQWLCQYGGVEEKDIVYAVQIHEKADISAALQYWAASLNVPPAELRTYLKRHNPVTPRRNIGDSYYGTIRMRVRRSTLLSRRIEGWIQGIVKYCGVV